MVRKLRNAILRKMPWRAAVLVVLACIAYLASERAAASPGETSMEEREHAWVLLSRATYGPRPGDHERVLSVGTAAWLEAQLHPESIDNALVEKKLVHLKVLELTTSELMQRYPRPSQEERQAIQQLRERLDAGERLSERERDSLLARRRGQQGLGQVLPALSEAKLLRAVYSERQLEEVLVDFWFNHFNVYAGKNRNVLLSLPSYERDAIRPHVLGKFEDLLLATAQHPAMLYYLDNWINTKEGFDPRQAIRAEMGSSRGERRGRSGARVFEPRTGGEKRRSESRPNRTFGINENFARELLELHTLGVDGGYSQQDVVEVARALTGWSVVGPRLARFRDRMTERGGRLPESLRRMPQEGHFVFNQIAHDENPKSILGTTIDSGGLADGTEVIRLLSRHPSTARFISTKLARRFAAEEPSESLVGEMTERFLETGGDIREVLRTMFLTPGFLEEARARNKVKTPLELVISALRATGAEVEGPALARVLGELGMPPYLCQPPTGYEEGASAWLSAGNVLSRARFVGDFLSGRLPGVDSPSVPEDVAGWAAQILPEELPGIDGDEQQPVDTLSEALSDFPSLLQSENLQAMALVLTSPAFQRQ